MQSSAGHFQETLCLRFLFYPAGK